MIRNNKMYCDDCGTELKIYSGEDGFYRFCPVCGATYNIPETDNCIGGPVAVL